MSCRHSRKVQALSIVLVEGLNGLQEEASPHFLCVCQRFCSFLPLLTMLVLFGVRIFHLIMKLCENYEAESCDVCLSGSENLHSNFINQICSL